MGLLQEIKDAGIVGCGGAGFPTHVKLSCTVEYLIINAAECEPLLRTDRYLMKTKAPEIITAVELVANMVKAQKVFIALKETYTEEIESLERAVASAKSNVQLYKMRNFYPAGDEQIMVCDVTGHTVPPTGIPLDVGAVVSNLATTYCIYEAHQKLPFTHKYLTVTGAAAHPTILHVPLGTSLPACIEAAGGSLLTDYHIVVGGPMMGKFFSKEDIADMVVTKTTSGILIVPDDTELVRRKSVPLKTILNRAKASCIQCSYCTQMCPRYLTGHPLQPHKIMRKLAYAENLDFILEDKDVQQAMICSECGLCETYACPMGLAPRQVNVFLKDELRKKQFRYPKPDATFHELEERSYRRAPSKKMAYRLGVAQYYDYRIDECIELTPEEVTIPLSQHIGAPSAPVVAVGDSVTVGQLIGAIPEKSLGANIHASLDGQVTAVSDSSVTIRRSAS
ncbi:MAG: 4Fe-4S dicluster domain-containing protein [Hespellia sp.]|nr:4Fe-4S dicluster domain-containing protein [Hespellia sp.]